MDLNTILCITAEAGKDLIIFCISKVKTFASYDHNHRQLRDELQKLIVRKNNIQESVEYGIREGKSPTFQAKRWLQDVEEVERDALQMLDEVPHTDTRACAPKCRIRRRYRRSKCMARICGRVKELINSCNFQVTLENRRSPVRAVERKPAVSLDGQEVATNMLRRLVEFIKDDRVNRIAVWGMGGVGKSTLVKNLINNFECLLTESFDIVIWITVPRNLDLGQIQSQIAERLSIEFDVGESMQGRANRLHRRLMKKRKSLLIFDDVWQKFDFEDVGIPQDDDQGKCKILLTTRSFDICREMMTDEEIKVDVLSEEAGWSLFAEIAEVPESGDIERMAKAICRRCGGLPLAIKAVGTSMRNKKKIELWKDALRQSRCQSPCPWMIKIYLPLELSYDSLPSDIHRSCFLYCSMYPESFSINMDELIGCWVADGLIRRHQNLEESYNNGIALIENLKDFCMLEQGDVIGTVKMHDVWRDLALWIRSKENKRGFFCPSSMLLHDILEKPQKSQHSFRRISLMQSNTVELPSQWRCDELRILFLQGNPLREIPEGFFRQTKALRYVNLSETSISSLPLSPHHSKGLQSLHSLLLRDCRCLEKLPPIGALQNLELLDLSGTRLRALPREMGKLIKLKSLNLSRTCQLEKIEVGALSGLTSLEVLDISYSGYRWDMKSNLEEDAAAFDELLSLEKLAVLQIRLDKFDCLATDTSWIMRLKKFRIWVSPTNFHEWNSLPLQHDEKRATIRGIDLMIFESGLEVLLLNATVLQLKTCGGVGELSDLFGRRSLSGLRNLKSIEITGCSSITNIINGENTVTKFLPNLEHLSLSHLENLVQILDGMAPRGCLRKLKTIHVADCPRLKNLVSHALLCQIRNLEEIKIRECGKMRCIFSAKVSANLLPKLRGMEMRNLKRLKMICHGTSEWPSLDKIEVHNCPKLQKLPFSLCSEISIKEVRGDVGWWNNLVWPDESTKTSLLERFEVFIPTPLRNEETQDSRYADAAEGDTQTTDFLH